MGIVKPSYKPTYVLCLASLWANQTVNTAVIFNSMHVIPLGSPMTMTMESFRVFRNLADNVQVSTPRRSRMIFRP